MIGGSGLASLRHAPVQRIPRYILLLRDLIKHTPNDNSEYPILERTILAYEDLANQVNSIINQHGNLKKLKDIDKKLQGRGRMLLVQSTAIEEGGKEDNQTPTPTEEGSHQWKNKKKSKIPFLCAWCHSVIVPGNYYSQCKICNTILHSKHCIHLVSNTCKTNASLLQQGRILISEFSGNNIKHSSLILNPGSYNAIDKSKKREKTVNILIFNDSLLIYDTRKKINLPGASVLKKRETSMYGGTDPLVSASYSSQSLPGTPTLPDLDLESIDFDRENQQNTETFHLIAFIRWKSFTTGRVVKVSSPSNSDFKISITAPRDGEMHFLHFSDLGSKLKFFNDVNDAIQSWFDKTGLPFQDDASIIDRSFRSLSMAMLPPMVQIPSNSEILSPQPIPNVTHKNQPTKFSILSTVPVHSVVKPFTAYLISAVYDNSSTSIILKRYSDFSTLNLRLREHYFKKYLPSLPSKRYLRDNVDKLFIQRRCRGLENYLNELLTLPFIGDNVFFKEFISSSLDAKSGSTVPSSNQIQEDEDEGSQSDDDQSCEENEPLVSPGGSVTQEEKQILGQVLYDFIPDFRTESVGMKVNKGEFVRILSTASAEWWFCTTMNGQSGYVPSTYISVYEA